MLSRDVKRLILRVHLDLCFCMGHYFTSHWESAPIGMLFEYICSNLIMITIIYGYIHNWIRYSYSFSAEAKHCTFECMLRRSASGKLRPRKESLQLYCCSMLLCKDHSSFSFVILVCWFDSCLGCKSDSSSPLNTSHWGGDCSAGFHPRLMPQQSEMVGVPEMIALMLVLLNMTYLYRDISDIVDIAHNDSYRRIKNIKEWYNAK